MQEDLFDEIIRIAQEKGVRFGKLQIVDTVHVMADVDLEKDKTRQKKGEALQDEGATWGVKGNKLGNKAQRPSH